MPSSQTVTSYKLTLGLNTDFEELKIQEYGFEY